MGVATDVDGWLDGSVSKTCGSELVVLLMVVIVDSDNKAIINKKRKKEKDKQNKHR